MRIALAGIVVAMVVVALACEDEAPTVASRPSGSTPTPTSVSAPTPIPTATVLPATPSAPAVLSWLGLTIADENRCSAYVPDDYPYPQSAETKIVDDMGGIIYGPYTGRYFKSTKDTDIEHIVARAEAHDSGLCDADSSTRRQFASDLLNLTLADPSVNRQQKSDKDAAEWLPDLNQCWFADRVVKVRQKYDLTIDQPEADALAMVLSECSSAEMVVVATPAQAVSTPTSAPRVCCKYCSKGKACGDSCIARNKTCWKGPGCACNR